MLATPQPAPSKIRTHTDEIETAAIERTPLGSSGSFDGSAGAQTMPGSLLGTPAYMSPEQALGQEVDFRSDIYALAVVAHLLVYGDLPLKRKARASSNVRQRQCRRARERAQDSRRCRGRDSGGTGAESRGSPGVGDRICAAIP